jgi:uncharacterized protein
MEIQKQASQWNPEMDYLSGQSKASFDCTKSQTSIEMLICSDVELSSMDRQVGELFKDARNKNPQKKKQLLKVQQRFLEKRNSSCKIKQNLTASELGQHTQVQCLKEVYAARLSELTGTSTAAQPNGIIFGRVLKLNEKSRTENYNR